MRLTRPRWCISVWNRTATRAAVVLTADEVRELIDTLTYIMRSNENRKGDGEHA